MLRQFNPDLELIVAADSSKAGICACIMHRFPDDSVKVIAHALRTLTKAEADYGQIEKKGLSFIFAVKKFYLMISCRHFVLQTDHKPLLSIFGSKSGVPVYSAIRLQRWATMLLNYDFRIEYVNTIDFGYADVLSRLICAHEKLDEEYVIASVDLENDLVHTIVDATKSLPVTMKMVEAETEKCQFLKQVIGFVQTKWPIFDEKRILLFVCSVHDVTH